MVVAEEEHTLEAVCHARRENIVEPVLIGDSQKIARYLEQFGESVAQEAIVHIADPLEAAAYAVTLIRDQQADF